MKGVKCVTVSVCAGLNGYEMQMSSESLEFKIAPFAVGCSLKLQRALACRRRMEAAFKELRLQRKRHLKNKRLQKAKGKSLKN